MAVPPIVVSMAVVPVAPMTMAIVPRAGTVPTMPQPIAVRALRETNEDSAAPEVVVRAASERETNIVNESENEQ